MINFKNLFKDILLIFSFLTKSIKIKLIGLQFLIIFASLAEIFNLLSLKFYIDIFIIEKKDLYDLYFIRLFFSDYSFDSIVFYSGIILIFLIIISSIIRIYTIDFQFKLSGIIISTISRKVFSNIIHKPYGWHISNTSSKTITILSNDIDKLREQIIWGLSLFLNLFLIFSIGISLIFISSFSIIFLVFISLFFLLVINFSRNSFKEKGKILTNSFESSINIIQESLDNIKDIIIGKNYNFYIDIFAKKYYRYISSNARINSNYQFPRLIIEGSIIVILVLTSLILFKIYGSGFVSEISTFAAISFGVYRILQPFQQLFVSISILNSYNESWNKIKPFLSDILDPKKLKRNKEAKNLTNLDYKKIEDINKIIELKNIWFKYPNSSEFALKKVNLVLKKGEKIAFVGMSGSGKTTCANIILGLLKPTKGSILIFEKKLKYEQNQLNFWHKNISHVSQNIYLTESTFAENIAFGLPKNQIDFKRVIIAAKEAAIHKVINKYKYGYQTLLGEDGQLISSGQRQRIGIARALYNNTEFIILDEATNAIDNINESIIKKNLLALSKNPTILCITHKIPLIKSFDKIVFFQNNGIKAVGRYEELMKTDFEFSSLVNAYFDKKTSP